MILKSFRFQCILRVILIIITMGIGLSLILLGNYLFSSIVLFLLLFIQTYDLINYVERTNRKIAHLISSIENSDFSQQFFDDRKNNALSELVTAMNSVISRFGENRKAREEALYFLGTILEKSPIAILVFEDSGQVNWANSSLLNLLEAKTLNHIDQLEKDYSELHLLLMDRDTKFKTELRIHTTTKLKYLSVRLNKFGIYGKRMHLLTLQNIHEELDTREAESWEKLMRVLTHEIMNSVTPILSLTESALEMVNSKTFHQHEELKKSLETIQSRSSGLLQFTQRYRQLTRIPKPQAETINAQKSIEEACSLLLGEFKEKQTELILDIESDLELYADPVLLQQVYINLLKNALEAIHETKTPKISIAIYRLKRRVIIDIIDNGTGISEGSINQIFVPFFSTKQEGSGIGLSLSREIIRSMGGSLRLVKSNENGTIMQILL